MNVMMKKQFSFYFAIVVLFGLLETAPAQNLIIRDSGCLYGVEGSCVPRRTTYGYYETHWRNWPFAQKPKVTGDRQKRSSPPTGSTALPVIEVPRSTDEASISPDLPNKQEELATDEPSSSPEQLDIDRQTDPFEDNLQTPDAEVPPNEVPANPFEDDLRMPATEVPGNEGQANPFQNDLQTPTLETPADESDATRLGPRLFNDSSSLAPSSAHGRNEPMRRPQYGPYNPLRRSVKRAKPGAIATNRLQATQAVALEEVMLDPRAKRGFPSAQVNSRNNVEGSNPLRR
jgi:hypothetical protein